jgi:Zn-dependent peptidase ImmA (M78 family)
MKIDELIKPHMVTHLLKLCKRELELSTFPKIKFVDQPSINGSSFGQYGNNKIIVITKDRHPIDIMRTLCHELVHWKQESENMKLDGTDGSDIENQANAIAGVIMRKFGKMYPEYFVNSALN